MRERTRLVARRARRHRRRRHGADRRAVDQRRLSRGARSVRRRRRRDRPARRRNRRDGQRACSTHRRASSRTRSRSARDARRPDRVARALRHRRRAVEAHRHGGERAVARRRAAGAEAAQELPHRRRPHVHAGHVRGHRRPRRGVAVRRPRRSATRVRWGTTDWNVVGIFEDRGSVAESEVWTDATVLQGAYNRGNSLPVDARAADERAARCRRSRTR